MRITVLLLLVLLLAAVAGLVADAAQWRTLSDTPVSVDNNLLSSIRRSVTRKLGLSPLRLTSARRRVLFASVRRTHSRRSLQPRPFHGVLLRAKLQAPPHVDGPDALGPPVGHEAAARKQETGAPWLRKRNSRTQLIRPDVFLRKHANRKLNMLNALSRKTTKRRLALFTALSRQSANRKPAPLTAVLSRESNREAPVLGSSNRATSAMRSHSASSPMSFPPFLILSSRLSQPTSSRAGLTLDPCSSDADCVDPRICGAINENVVTPCRGEPNCVCVGPAFFTGCTASSECPLGEVCASFGVGSGSICLSAEQVENDPELIQVDDVLVPSPSANETSPEGPNPVNETDASSGGLTGDGCESDAECVPDRTCLNVEDSSCVFGDDLCICIPPEFIDCTSSADCVPGEVCAKKAQDAGAICISEQFEEESGFIEVGPVSTGGFTGDECESDAGCVPDRTCLNVEAGSCVFGDGLCICIPPEVIDCTSSADCVSGEVCAKTAQDEGAICLSEQFEEESDSFAEVGSVNTTMPSVSPLPTMDPVEPPQPGGLTGDGCITDADCLENRFCPDDSGSGSCSTAAEMCICVPPEFAECISSADCVEGEVCVAISNDPICVSQQLEQETDGITEVGTSPSPEEGVPSGTVPPSGGLTVDPCESDGDCMGDRTCSITGDCFEPGNCLCAPQELTACTSSVECVEGEVCAKIDDVDDFGPICVSQQAEEEIDGLTEVDAEVVSTPGAGSGGFTGDSCTSDFECSSDRSCVTRDGGIACSGDDSCVCVPAEIIVCTSNADCVIGEVCATPSTSMSSEGICLSEDLVGDVAELDEIARTALTTSRLTNSRLRRESIS